jgi:hypothetical protein
VLTCLQVSVLLELHDQLRGLVCVWHFNKTCRALLGEQMLFFVPSLVSRTCSNLGHKAAAWGSFQHLEFSKSKIDELFQGAHVQ